MALTQQAIDLLKSKPESIVRLANANDKNWQTMYKWILANDERLTMAKNLEIISEVTGLKQSEILEPITTA